MENMNLNISHCLIILKQLLIKTDPGKSFSILYATFIPVQNFPTPPRSKFANFIIRNLNCIISKTANVLTIYKTKIDTSH